MGGRVKKLSTSEWKKTQEKATSRNMQATGKGQVEEST
jgi:hypothetical protein